VFSIKSSSSSRELVFSAYEDGYFLVELKGEVAAAINVWAYTDALALRDLFQELAELQRPWQGSKSWGSVEGELSISATCSALGEVVFSIALQQRSGSSEDWRIQAGLVTELGQLPSIAKGAALFLIEPST
jgi:hypothetical protein